MDSTWRQAIGSILTMDSLIHLLRSRIEIRYVYAEEPVVSGWVSGGCVVMAVMTYGMTHLIRRLVE